MTTDTEVTVTFSLNEWKTIRNAIHSRAMQWYNDETEEYETRKEMYDFFRSLSIALENQLGE